MTTHRVVQLSSLEDTLSTKANLWRRCALKAANIGNRNAAIYWTGKAIHADRILVSIRSRLYQSEAK